MVDKTENACINCKHFVRHYFMLGIRFLPTSYGHCQKRNFKRAFQPEEIRDCRCWQAAEVKKNDRKKTAFAILKDIDDKLNVVVNFLTYSTE